MKRLATNAARLLGFLAVGTLLCWPVVAFAAAVSTTGATYYPNGVAVNSGLLYTVNATTLEASQIDLSTFPAKVKVGTSSVTTSATIASGMTTILSVTATLSGELTTNTAFVTATISGTDIVLRTYNSSLAASVAATTVNYAVAGQ